MSHFDIWWLPEPQPLHFLVYALYSSLRIFLLAWLTESLEMLLRPLVAAAAIFTALRFSLAEPLLLATLGMPMSSCLLYTSDAADE